jgi:uncharacterized protein Yka (UPF0111/DUF47 family)
MNGDRLMEYKLKHKADKKNQHVRAVYYSLKETLDEFHTYCRQFENLPRKVRMVVRLDRKRH